MAFDTVIDKAQLEGAITASANAIRGKTGGEDPIQWLSDKGFSEAIAAIETGVQLPPLDDAVRATASDMAQGKQLYDENGNLVEGSVEVITDKSWEMSSDPEITEVNASGGKRIRVSRKTALDRKLLVNVVPSMGTPASNFGNATAADVAKGKTFTSAAGLLVEGTLEVGTPETWTLTLEDGSTVEKVVYVK
jgi:hypothetical protein